MIKVLVESESEKFVFTKKGVKEAVVGILEEKKLADIDIEVSVSVVGKETMEKLHHKYLETLEVTDVLSFPIAEISGKADFSTGPDGILRLGDVVICYPVAVSQASWEAKTIDEEIRSLVSHGCRHLTGEHHE